MELDPWEQGQGQEEVLETVMVSKPRRNALVLDEALDAVLPADAVLAEVF
ncbi:MAG: hypothetical protein WBJ23_03500 [Anaerolineaceae bacterium]|jgi:hypothetical protein